MDISDQEFERLIARAMDELPRQYIENMDNVAVVFADEPSPEQSARQGLRKNDLLLGLYEGLPMTARLSSSYSGVLPDKITLFKQPLIKASHSKSDFYEQIKRTLWHEIAHHYGLDHDDIENLEK